MIKTLQNTLRQDREGGFILPRSVQDCIPVRRLYADGIFQYGSKFSKVIRFSDINYAIASREDKMSMFLGYSELLNALDTGSTTKITINNKRLNRQNFESEILLPMTGDLLDGFREEYNEMLMGKVTDSSNSVVQERYVTLSVHKKTIEEARTFFDRVTADVTTRLSHLDSRSEELDAVERLRVLHDFYRTGHETEYSMDLQDYTRKGHSFKDAICPDSLEFKKDHFVMGDKYGRVLFLREYASYIKDSMITELTSLNRTMMLSIDVIPVPTDEAVREMQTRLLGVETNVTNWQRRQNNNNNFSAVVPYDLEQQRKETREMLDDLTTRDQRMMFAVVTLVHLADSKEELDADTEALQSIARKHLCQLAPLAWQQMDGLITALPIGLRRIDALRTLTTEALAVLMPFKAQEVRDRGGIYYGQNVISKNLIIANRKELLNGNGFVLGVSGSGKSFTAKREMLNLALATDDDIIVIDPESEYRPLIESLGGEVVNISATSQNHINEWYSKDCSKKVRSAYRAKAIKGEFTGPVAPYGYRKDPADKHHLLPNECAPIIQRMFRMALEGKTCCMIANTLQREQILTPQAYAMIHEGMYYTPERKNNPYAWTTPSVKALLSNPVYTGNMVSQRATSRSYKDKRVVFRPKEEWITVENTHEPLVDKVTFDTVQERLKIKKPDWTYNPNNIFRGLLFCGECGRRMVFSSWACAKGGVTGKFSCAKYRRYGGNECSAHNIGLSDLKTLVLEDIRRHASLAAADRERYVDYLVSLSSREWDGERASWTKEAERCRKRLDELDAIIRKLYEDSVFGRVSEERYATLSASYEDESKKLKDRYSELQDRIAAYGKQSKSSGDFAELVARYTDITELTEELLNTLVEKIVLHEKEDVDGECLMRVEIYYRFIGSVGGSSGDDLMAKNTIGGAKRH